MTQEQKSQLFDLLSKMRDNARRCRPGPEETARWVEVDDLTAFLEKDPGLRTVDEWMAIAERDAAGHDTSLPIRMTMDQILTGKPPEHFRKGS